MQRGWILLFLLATACASPGGSSPTSEPGADPQGAWRLVDGQSATGPIPLVDDHPITISVADSSITGVAACNRYGARIEPGPGGIVLAELGMTAMACAPDEVMRSEAAFIEALSAVRSIRTEGDALVLEGPGVELRFAGLPPPPTAELLDTTWELETLIVGDVATPAMGEPASLLVRADGTFTGSTGCRTFDGSWIEDGAQLLATQMAMDDRVCPEELADQDNHVVSVIGDGFVPTIDGDLLTLVDPGGIGLVYRAAE